MTEEQNRSATSTSGQGASRDTPTTFYSLLVMAMGALVAGFSAWVDAGFLTLALVFLFFPIGASVILTGLLLAVTNSFRPLTPVRAWVFPVGVVVALAAVFWYKSRPDLIWGGATALLGAAYCGTPLGAALKRGNTPMALGAVGVVAAGIVLVWTTTIPWRFTLNTLVALVVLSIPATAFGLGLTSGASE